MRALAHSIPRSARRSTLALLSLVAVLLLAFTACSSQGASSGSDDAAQAARPAEGADGPEAAEEAGDSDAAGAGQDEVAAGVESSRVGIPGGTERQIITSRLSVHVDDVAAAAERVRVKATAAGGHVAGEATTGGEDPHAEITLRVPVDATDDVMADVAELGSEQSRSTDSQDVETQLVDLESRTDTQRAGVERIRALLSEAETLQDVLLLEGELTERQADLESVMSQQASLSERAALATLTVMLSPSSDADTEEALPPFLEGLRSGWDALVASTTVLAVVL